MDPQPSTCARIFTHRHLYHFLAYSFSYALLGQFLTCLGPMFPYLAESEGRVETEYEILLTARALGFLSGALLCKVIGTRLTFHQLIVLGIVLLSSYSMTFSSMPELYPKAIVILIASIGGCFLDISLNLASLNRFNGENVATWLQAVHGCYAIGGLVGPIVVYFFALNALTFLGFVGLATTVIYYFLPTP